MPNCAHCPLKDASCRGLRVPSLCGWVDPTSPRFHPNGAAALLSAAGRAASAAVAAATTTAAATILAGDLVEMLAHHIGADKAARKVAKWLGTKDCGCAGRKLALNEAHRKAIALTQRLASRLPGRAPLP